MSAASALAALGIVYGDRGTSPLYTMQAVLAVLPHPDARAALGVLSLIVWALIVTISVKYCVVVMRADNHGEGGILALMTLIGADRTQRRWVLVAMGLFGAALIYGDGIITPAISVLSAVEGVNIATDALKPYVLPIAAVILVALFAVQSSGTAKIGNVFGPVMLVWFGVAALLGLLALIRRPEVLLALDPALAVGFPAREGWQGFSVLGGVFLAITGGEALSADMGHIGRRPIRASWYGIVLPALLLNYAGQTALLVDGVFFAANLLKIADGGWIPLLVAAGLYAVMTTWRRGIEAIRHRVLPLTVEPGRFLETLEHGRIARVAGTAVFLTGNQRPVPVIILRHAAEMGALHAELVSLTVQFQQIPRVPPTQRVQVEPVFDGFWHISVRWGFMDTPDLSAALACAREHDCPVDFSHALYFGARDDVVASLTDRLLPFWQRTLFAFLYRNAVRTVDRFSLPADRFKEVGRQIEV
jgi:K+ transporter